MNDTMHLLQMEHRNIAKLLVLIETQIQALEKGEAPDSALLHSIVEYLSGYPDVSHHPKEDLLLRKMRRRDPTLVRGLADLMNEHQELTRLTGHLQKLVKEESDRPGVGDGALIGAMRQLVDYYRHHMEMEERHFFPRAFEVLSDSDWAEIDFAVFDRDDPLYDKAADQLSVLRDKIDLLADDQEMRHVAQARLEHEEKFLGGLTGLERFCETMRDRGIQARLVRLPDGKYGLEIAGRPVLIIPDCSEARAAWCAYCFVMGWTSRAAGV